MKKQIIIILLFISASLLSVGQEHAINAANLIVGGKLDQAQKELKLALADESEKVNPYTWHINAYFLKEKYKENTTANTEYRNQAIKAAKRSIELDRENTYVEKTKKIINYLSATYLKEAFTYSKSSDTLQIERALEQYKKYENSIKIITPEENFTETKNKVLLHIANQYEKIYYQDKNKKSLIKKAIKNYEIVLGKDSLNYDANYNISVDYYNLAVDEISKIDAETPFWELIYIQELSIELFKNSLPYMTTAYRLNPQRIHSLKGLMQIHRALGNEEKYLYFKEKTEEQQ